MHTPHITAHTSTWVKRFAKFGLAMKGIVYILSGALALLGALSIGNDKGRHADKAGVFGFLYEQPMGKVLLAIVAVGLLCYAVWRIVQGIADTEQKGNDLKGWANRASYIFRGLLYLLVAVYAGKILLHHSTGGGNGNKELAKELMDKPFGQVMVGVIALVMFVSGVMQLYRAFSDKYKKYVDKAQYKSHIAAMLVKTGKIGYAARGLVWFIIGWLFLKAAVTASPGKAGGSEDVFHWLQSWQYGDVLLAIVAAGLVCYGIFMLLRARYQQVNTA